MSIHFIGWEPSRKESLIIFGIKILQVPNTMLSFDLKINAKQKIGIGTDNIESFIETKIVIINVKNYSSFND